jgi:hypothetical protein
MRYEFFPCTGRDAPAGVKGPYMTRANPIVDGGRTAW